MVFHKLSRQPAGIHIVSSLIFFLGGNSCLESCQTRIQDQGPAEFSRKTVVETRAPATEQAQVREPEGPARDPDQQKHRLDNRPGYPPPPVPLSLRQRASFSEGAGERGVGGG